MKKDKFGKLLQSILKINCVVLFFSFSCCFSLWAYDLDALEIKQYYKEDGISLSVEYPDSYYNSKNERESDSDAVSDNNSDAVSNHNDKETISVFYRSFNPVNNIYSNGKIKKGEDILVPFGTEICIWAKSSSGKLSKAFHLIAETSDKTPLLNVLSPREGTWNAPQYLIIKSPKKTQIMYSIDGSDPEQFGLLYTKPILIEKEGDIELRVKAIGESGLSSEKKIKYSVISSVETDMTDLAKPANRPVLTPEINSEEDTLEKENTYSILNWYFIEFNFDSPIYYLIKQENSNVNLSELLNIYDGPIFTDRTKDSVLYWTNKNFKDGKINKIILPKIPVLSSVPRNAVNKTIELNFDDNRYTYFFEIGDGKTYIYPTKNSEKFKKDGSGVFDSGIKNERFFDVKIRALYAGIFHGEFKTSFKIDKLPPERPEVIFNPPFSPTNTSVKITIKPVFGAEIIAEIEPPIYTSSDNNIVLTGTLGEKTIYSVSVYSKDEAGNKSTPIIKEFIIDRNAVYVDYNSKAKSSDGNPSNPFSTIHEAIDYINKVSFSKKNRASSEKWKIYVRGDCILNEAVLITRNIKITSVSSRSSIHFSKNAGFVVIGAGFELENCDVFRREITEEPRDVPLIYADKANIKLNNVKLQVIEGGGVLNSFYSHLDISDSKIISEQTNYCVMFNINNSSAVLQNLDFNGTGFSIAAISSANSIIELDDIRSSLKAGFTARFLEAWNSEISLGSVNSIRLPETAKNRDTAIWYNKNSKIDIKYKPIIRGFSKSIEREP